MLVVDRIDEHALSHQLAGQRCESLVDFDGDALLGGVTCAPKPRSGSSSDEQRNRVWRVPPLGGLVREVVLMRFERFRRSRDGRVLKVALLC